MVIVQTAESVIPMEGYPNNKWNSDSFKPYREDISNIRDADGNHVIRREKNYEEQDQRGTKQSF